MAATSVFSATPITHFHKKTNITTFRAIKCMSQPQDFIKPPAAPKVSTKFSDVLAFSGSAPERFNGRHKQRNMDATREGEEGDRDISLKDLSKKLEEFAKARDWEKYHTPRNLLLAMVGEVGELSEIFQWKGEVEKGLENWEESEKEHLGEELSDVLLYLIRLADICGINLAQAALDKIIKNAIKYPLPDLDPHANEHSSDS
ncbi:NTP pyrophosphohydrolase MazG [Artemisia annua]|uniref:NTP pyrophosphohydrolase MazG n=1 Tax=Artemisia annua TaxID=35608 RepID=A0A2U1LWW7_ARTAN|nr:NTP pyrophosphohydrolase MazG [Artemisia annua]